MPGSPPPAGRPPAASPAQRVAVGREEIPCIAQFSAKPETEPCRVFLSWWTIWGSNPRPQRCERIRERNLWCFPVIFSPFVWKANGLVTSCTRCFRVSKIALWCVLWSRVGPRRNDTSVRRIYQVFFSEAAQDVECCHQRKTVSAIYRSTLC